MPSLSRVHCTETPTVLRVNEQTKHATSSSRVHRTETQTVLHVQSHSFANLAQVPLFPAPTATHPGAALGRLGVRVTNQPTRCWVGCSFAVRGLPKGQVCLAPWAAKGTSVGYYAEPGVLRDYGDSGCLFPFGTGGYPACYQCGVASAQIHGFGSHGAVVPQYQVTLLASFPSLHHAYHGSLVTPSVCSWPLPLVSPHTRVRDV